MFERIKKIVEIINNNYHKHYECYTPKSNKISFISPFLSDKMFLEMLNLTNQEVYPSEILVNFNDKTLEFYQ